MSGSSNDRVVARAAIRRRRWFTIGALVLGGCASDCGASSNPGTIGELGNGRFHYVCQGSSDPVCEFETDQQFPDCIAVGGRFALEYDVLDTSIFDPTDIDPLLFIESISQKFFRGDDDFEALEPGNAAFIVREQDAVLDFLHLTIVEADWIEVIGRDPTVPLTEVELENTERRDYRVFPRHTTCPSIGGSIPITAQSSDESVVSVSSTDVLQLVAEGPGAATVRVQLGDVEQAIAVQVGPSTDPPDPSTGSDSNGSTDDSGSDSGTTGGSGTDSSGGSDSDGGSSSGSSTGGSR